ncbi:type III-B CRISPR module-associated protein Cmr5 [Hyalangium sp.]|uniref:type III-B CRISPR module-associated protein Cmr5 n=1 Tax=Hyalangium sp. TaxID=2028555 RepID=UPI002D543728|nr:type III-B CRISPR module-associated protein Cmr5 [Hyalangium sp.]HYH97867.1 type III-B CRISPR module-associated protein Cmr5 [Hyalangium sp.]
MKRLTRDQRRALHAYQCVERVPAGEREDYKTRVGDLGSTVLRNGLAAALAFLEREQDKKAVVRLLGDLASAGIPGLSSVPAEKLPGKVRDLELRSYMLATREVLHLAVWFQRAVQATFTKKKEGGHVAGAGR